MSVNPYQSPEIVAEPDDGRAARRWVAAPAIGIWLTGWIYLIFGLAIVVFALVLVGRFAYAVMVEGAPVDAFATDLLTGALGFLVMGAVATGLGWAAVYCSRRFYRLDSSNVAIAACVLGVIMYPMCILTLPLGIYGLIVLRRGDVQRELLRNKRGRTSTLAGASHVDA